MKLDNKGFAISTFMYMLLILAIILILATLAILSSRRMIIEKQKNTALDNISYPQNKICTAVNGVKSLQLGTEYSCEVKDGTFFTFYVLSTEGTKVNLIMDRNICEDGTSNYTIENNYCRYAWYEPEANNSFGPITAMTVLYNATKEWDNVPDMILNYKDEGERYTGINSTSNKVEIISKNGTVSEISLKNNKALKSRMPKENEITILGCEPNNVGSCPTWIVRNLNYYDTTESLGYDKYINNYDIDSSHIYTYWLINSSKYSATTAYVISNQGYISHGSGVNATNAVGIRPVITLSKRMLK